MSTISHHQTRRNCAAHRRRLRARHAQAGRWKQQSKPMLGAGKIRYEVSRRVNATLYGGIGAAHRLITKIGLPEQINRSGVLKRNLPYFDSDHVLTLAYSVYCGGTRLGDIERLRQDVSVMDALGARLIPSPTAVGDYLRRHSEGDIETLMDGINEVRPQLWNGRGRDLLGPVTYIDVDGTIVPTDGEKKEGLGLSYKKVWGYQPLIVTLANTGEVLYIDNRPGNAASHSGAAKWIDKSIDLVGPHAERLCLRGDTAFSLTTNFDRWSGRADFVFGYTAHRSLVARAEALEEDRWQQLKRRPRWVSETGETRQRRPNEKARIVRESEFKDVKLKGEHVAEFEYRPRACRKAYRMVVVRKNLRVMRGELDLGDEVKYLFYITTLRGKSRAEVVRLANQRCDQENLISQLKSGMGALRVPMYDLVSNWAYMVIAALAWNLKSWMAMQMHYKSQRRRYVKMEFKRFVREMVLIPCQVIRKARQTTLRVIGWQPSVDLLYRAWCTIERTEYG